MDRQSARQTMIQLYETQYGIYDHVRGGKHRPLAQVAMHPAYDHYEESLMNDLGDRYDGFDIHGLFHITFLDYVSLPGTVTHLLDGIARRIRDRKAAKAKRDADEAAARSANAAAQGR